jgi:hypothetical protein
VKAWIADAFLAVRIQMEAGSKEYYANDLQVKHEELGKAKPRKHTLGTHVVQLLTARYVLHLAILDFVITVDYDDFRLI